MLITLDASQPLHRQIYEKIRSMVLSGTLQANAKLPATRELAEQLSVSRTTVLQAYEQLIAEGYIHTREGSGTYVSPLPKHETTTTSRRVRNKQRYLLSDTAGLAARLAGPMLQSLQTVKTRSANYNFSPGVVRMDNRSRQIWRSLVSHCMRERIVPPPDHRGFYPLRVAIAGYLKRVRNCRCDADNIVITHGAQQAFDLLGRLLLDPGDIACLENPCWTGARLAFQACCAKSIYIDVDDSGMKVDKLEKNAGTAKLVYVTPSHQFPTGHIMSLTRRLQLIEWARANDACIIEDDYDSEFHYSGRPLESIQAIDPHERTIYVGTFSKVLSPELRLGYVVLPDSLVQSFVALRWIAGLQSVPQQQHALASWMDEGYHHQHMRRMHKLYKERFNVLQDSLRKYFSGDEIRIEGSNTGLHILLWFKRIPGSSCMACWEELYDSSIVVFPAAVFYNKQPPLCGFVLGFGLIDAHDIENGIRYLRQTVVKYYA